MQYFTDPKSSYLRTNAQTPSTVVTQDIEIQPLTLTKGETRDEYGTTDIESTDSSV